jgi:hypothetical protein
LNPPPLSTPLPIYQTTQYHILQQRTATHFIVLYCCYFLFVCIEGVTEMEFSECEDSLSWRNRNVLGHIDLRFSVRIIIR